MYRGKLCPLCKTPMAYIQESEVTGNEKRIVRYYRCPACGAKIIDEVLKIVKVNGSVKIMVEQNGSGKLIKPQRITKRPRQQSRRHR